MGPLVAPLIMAGGSLLGGLLGNRKQTQTTTPTMDPAYSGLQSQLLSMITNRLRQGSSLPAGYEAGQIGQINNTFARAGQGLQNRLTAAGLANSPVAGAGLANMDAARAGQIVQMQQKLPLMERDMQSQDLGMAQALMGMGRGTQTTQGGNMLGGGITSLTDMLAYLYGKGALGGK